MPQNLTQQQDRGPQAEQTAAAPSGFDFGRFLTRRAWRNAEALASLASCTNPLEALDVWREAALDAIEDYAEEAGRMLEPLPA